MSGAPDYQALFGAAPAAMLVIDPDLVIVDANEAYLAATMRTREQLAGRPVFEAFPDNPDDPDASGVALLGTSLRRVLDERVADVMPILKYDIARPDGGFDVRYWTPVNTPVFGPDGALRWIIHRVVDVTGHLREAPSDAAQLAIELQERIGQAEAAVHARRVVERRQEALQAVVDSLEVAVVASDDTGRPVLYNDAARELIGPDITTMTAADWGSRLHLHHPDGRPVGTDLPLLRALRGERVRDAELVRRTPGRPRRFFRVHSRPVTGQPGLAAVVAIHEMTAHRRAARFQECELALARVTREPKTTEDILHDAIAVTGSLIGWDAVEFWIHDDATAALRRMICWSDPTREVTFRLPGTLPGGAGIPGRAWQARQPVWVADLPAEDAGGGDWGKLRTALAIPLPTGPHALGVLVGYSETVEIPEDVRAQIIIGIAPSLGEFLARRRAERLAGELDRAHDQYLSLAGHELRTPLTSIQSYADLLLDEPGLSEDQQHMLTAIQRNAASLRAVILKVLDVAELRTGRLDVRPQRMDLAAVTREAAEAARADDSAHVVEVHAPGRAIVDGDPHRLRQVVDELLANALVWAPDGTGVAVRLHADADATVLSVANTGPRIPSDERDHLYDLFFRGDSARRRGTPGSGLGLSLVRAVVEQHGGTVTLGEPDDVTTVFTVRLPGAPAE